MKSVLLAALLSAAPLAAAAQAPARVENGYVVNAPWAQRPTLEQAHEAYPPFALERDIKGAVTLDCLVMPDGALDCRVDSETPADRSFGGASLGLARLYRMTANLADGTPTAGLRARLNMSYNPPPAKAQAGAIAYAPPPALRGPFPAPAR
jgi:hypothetical protein